MNEPCLGLVGDAGLVIEDLSENHSSPAGSLLGHAVEHYLLLQCSVLLLGYEGIFTS